MTSISSAFGATSIFTPATSAADRTAIGGALTDILGQLKSGAAAATTASNATTPDTMKDKVDGLIDNEVSAGKLSSDQATELKSMFAKAIGHMHHVHAPKSGGDAIADLASTADDATDPLGVGATGATTSSSTGTGTSLIDEASKALGDFISGIKSATAAGGLYGAGGLTHGGLGSLLVHAFA